MAASPPRPHPADGHRAYQEAVRELAALRRERTALARKLKAEQRLLIDLAYFQGYTHGQIAKALDIPLGPEKTRIRSALTQLRALLT